MTTKRERDDEAREDAREDAAQDRADARAARHQDQVATPVTKAVAVEAVSPLRIGDIVHHVNHRGECQAAIVTGLTSEPDRVLLTVFPVGGAAAGQHDAGGDVVAGTWHKPE